MRALLAAALALAACTDAAGVSQPGQTLPSPDASSPPPGAADAGADASRPPPPEAGPPMVHDCSSLPSAGTWVKINPPNAGPSSFMMATDPHANGTVWVM